jgi:hypothetical protein
MQIVKERDEGTIRLEWQENPVTKPAHYTAGAVEVIDFIDQTLDGYADGRTAHYVGCALKYLARAPHKGRMQQDLEKAEWYLRRAINRTAALAK